MAAPRASLLLIAIALSVLTVAVELGASWIPGAQQSAQSRLQLLQGQLSGELRDTFQELDQNEVRAMLEADHPPGVGIAAMALIDGILMYSLILVGIGLVMPERIQGRIQGLATCVVAVVVVLVSIALAFATFGQILLMIGLLLSVPFGTIAYMAKFGFFDTGTAAVILSLIMTCKLASAGLLIASNQRFLENRGLIVLILFSLVVNVVLAILHGFPPGFLVSITDAVGALVFAILAIIWGILLFLSAVGSVFNALRFDRGLA